MRLAMIATAIGILLTASFVFTAQAAEDMAEYWTVEQYIANNPDQLKKRIAFIKRVEKSASGDYSKDRPVRVGVVYPGLQASDYWRRSVASFEKRLQELGQKYQLLSYFTKSGLAVSEQSQKLGQFIASDVDYLVFTLNVARHKLLIRKILARGSPKIILQNITTPLKAFRLAQPFQYVGFDHAIGTQYLVQRYLKIFKDGAQYAIFYGVPGYVSQMRGGTFLQEMQKSKKMILKASYYVDFDRKKSYRAALDVLKNYPDINFIFSASTDIALGVVDALRETGKMGKIITNGWGGGSAELNAVAAGDLNFTVMRMNDDNGVAMAEAIVMDQAGDTVNVPTIFSGNMLLVDTRMTADEIGKLKQRAFRYSK